MVPACMKLKDWVFLASVAALLAGPGINLVSYWQSNPLYAYGAWVPFLAGILAWRCALASAALEMPVPPEREKWLRASGTALIGCFLLLSPVLRVVQIANPDWRLLDWIYSLGAVSAVLSLGFLYGGLRWVRRFWYPVIFLLLAVPWPIAIENRVTSWLVAGIGAIAPELLWMAGVATIEEGRALLTPVGTVGISEDCGGMRSLQVALMASVFWAGLLRLRGWGWVGVIGMGVLFAAGANLGRILGVVGLATRLEKAGFIEEVHDTAGQLAQWALLAAIPVAAWLLAQRFRSPTDPKRAIAESDLPGAVGACMPRAVFPSGWSLAIPGSLLLAFFGAEWWFGHKESEQAEPMPEWQVVANPPIAGVTAKPISQEVRRNYRFSQAASLDWPDAGGVAWSLLWLRFERGDLSACTHNVHRPEVCLPSAAFAMAGAFPDLSLEINGTPLLFHHQVYRRGPEILHLFFSTLHEKGAEKELSIGDWTYQGRLRAAWFGVRSKRADIIHLVAPFPYPPDTARQLASEYLKAVIQNARPAPGEGT